MSVWHRMLSINKCLSSSKGAAHLQRSFQLPCLIRPLVKWNLGQSWEYHNATKFNRPLSQKSFWPVPAQMWPIMWTRTPFCVPCHWAAKTDPFSGRHFDMSKQKKSTCRIYKINDGCIPFRWASSLNLVLCMLTLWHGFLGIEWSHW